MKKKIIILGSKGFIGSNIYNHLSSRMVRVYGCDVSEDVNSKNYIKYLNNNDLSSFFSNNQFDICINAAGNGNVQTSVSNPSLDFDANVSFTQVILEAIRTTQTKCTYIHLSSAAVYGNPEKLPVNEYSALNPISPYGFHKVLAEQLCRQYAGLYGIQCIALRPFSVYGPGLKKQLIWDVHEKFNKAENKESVVFFGTGNETRDFIYIEDLCRIIELLITKLKQLERFDIFNISNGEEVKIYTIIEFIANQLGKTSFHFTGNTREGDPNNWEGDISKLKKLGYCRKFSLEKGLEEYTNWYLNHIIDK